MSQNDLLLVLPSTAYQNHNLHINVNVNLNVISNVNVIVKPYFKLYLEKKEKNLQKPENLCT